MRNRTALAGFFRMFDVRSVVAMLTGLCVLLSGCVSMKSVPPPVPGQPIQAMAVKVGDKVQIQTQGGELYAFTVTAVEPAALVGKVEAGGREIRIRYDDIAKLQVRRIDAVRTSLAGVGTILVVVVLVFLLGGGMHVSPMGA